MLPWLLFPGFLEAPFENTGAKLIPQAPAEPQTVHLQTVNLNYSREMTSRNVGPLVKPELQILSKAFG